MGTITDLIFITGNPHKAKYVAEWLGHNIAHRKLDLDELQTLDLHELVSHKARQAYELVGGPVLVEDAQLTFGAFGRLPGPFIKWFLQELGPAGIPRLLADFSDKTAIGTICYALFDGITLRFFEGTMRGTIAPKPRGAGGFGFDAIFINEGYNQTRAEMPEQDYAATSYRKMALDKLATFLRETST